MTYNDAMSIIESLDSLDYELNEWEEEFVESIIDRDKEKELTEKQATCLNGIYQKAAGGGKFQKKEYFKK